MCRDSKFAFHRQIVSIVFLNMRTCYAFTKSLGRPSIIFSTFQAPCNGIFVFGRANGRTVKTFKRDPKSTQTDLWIPERYYFSILFLYFCFISLPEQTIFNANSGFLGIPQSSHVLFVFLFGRNLISFSFRSGFCSCHSFVIQLARFGITSVQNKNLWIFIIQFF